MRTSSSLRSSSASHPSSHTASGRYCCNKRMTVKNSCSRITCFNTASGKYYYFITFVFPSLRSGTRDVWSSSSLCSSAGTLRRIPQAVSTVATGVCKYAELHSRHCKVSIPQAVSTVTSSPLFSLPFGQGLEMCGPHRRFTPLLPRTLRRIPQAVGTVATYVWSDAMEEYMFQYRKR